MRKFPIAPTSFASNIYEPEWFDRDFFYSPDGIQEFPQHHCKLGYQTSKPFITSYRNAIDIGCRDGEFTRFLAHDFGRVYCFDSRWRKYFSVNVPLEKVTHFTIPLGDGVENKRLGGRHNFDPKEGRPFTRLDDFKLRKIDYIKIDTDGYERAIIEGGLETIRKYWPMIFLEVFFEEETLKYCVDELGYKIAAISTSDTNDHVLVKSH